MRHFFTIWLTLVALLTTSAIASKAQAPSEKLGFDQEQGMHYLSDELLVTFHKATNPSMIAKLAGSIQLGNKKADAVLKASKVSSLRSLATVDSTYVLTCEGCDIDELKRKLTSMKSLLRFVEFSYVGELTSCGNPVSTNDPFGNETMLDLISGRCAWNLADGTGSVVGVVDATGYGLGNPDATGKV